MSEAALSKKINRRNAVIAGAVVVVILLLLWRRKRITDTIIEQHKSGIVMPGTGGDFSWSVGDINIGGINIPDLTTYDQQSSCGCSIATAEIQGNTGPVYYAPAKVNQMAPTIVQYQELVVSPPAPTRQTYIMSVFV